jgi:ketosteroid isomerase-like protein
MSVEENKALARRQNEERGFAHPESFDEYFHRDYAIYGGSEGRWPARGGREELGSGFEEFLQQNPTFAVVVDDIIGEGDKVAIRATFMIEGKPTANAMTFYRFADGKIIEDWHVSTPIEQ